MNCTCLCHSKIDNYQAKEGKNCDTCEWKHSESMEIEY